MRLPLNFDKINVGSFGRICTNAEGKLSCVDCVSVVVVPTNEFHFKTSFEIVKLFEFSPITGTFVFVFSLTLLVLLVLLVFFTHIARLLLTSA